AAQSQGPKLSSPYQPPPGYDDLGAQVSDIELVTTAPLDTSTGGCSYPHSLEVAGEVYRVRTPRPEALHAFTTAVSPHVKGVRLKNDMTQHFVGNHTHPEDFERVVFRMMDPEDRFTKDDLATLMKSIMTLGTARPIRPSSHWR